MPTALDLDPLLDALRAAGLRVGIAEVLSLRQVFAGEPRLIGGEVSRDRLRALLRAVLVKSTEDRTSFDRVFEAWFDRAEEESALRRVRQAPLPRPARPRRPWRKVAWQALAAVSLTALLLVMDRDMRFVPEEPSPPVPLSHPPARPAGEGAPAPGVTPDEVRKRTFVTTVAVLEAQDRPWHFLLRPEMGMALFAWVGAGGLWLALRHRRLLPEPEPLPPAEGPPRAFPLPAAAHSPLLAPRDQEGLAWGIGRFVSTEPTRRLDLAATVEATARTGGLPELRFHHARFHREVWLWVDEDADDPALPRLAAEIEAVLAAHGLPVERAAFRGIPDRLVAATGQVFAPNEIDERRDVALVAILTDGRRLIRRWAVDSRRARLDTLLRSLSHWPRLAFVTPATGREGLAAILRRHGLAVIPPEHAATFLGGMAPRRSPPEAGGRQQAGEAAWAAACALCPAPVDVATALELRRRLRLPVSPFALQALRAEAPGPPGRLAWPGQARVQRVSWLCAAEMHPRETVAGNSLLARALSFWEEIYDRSLAAAGEESAAVRFLRMERALLRLWRRPAEAITELYDLHQGPLQDEITRHLGVLAPAGCGSADLIHLPWTWAARTPVERAMLRALGLGGAMPPVGLRRPGRAWLGIGGLLGLGLIWGGGAFQRHAAEPPEIVVAGTRTVRRTDDLTFVRIRPGSFTMGSRKGDPDAYEDEWPAHEVTLDEFWMSKFETTNKQYRKLHPQHQGDADLPVSGVSWFEARDFCEKLGHRLPTEAEWEYAARAGTETPWSFGNNQRDLDRYAWFDGNSGGVAHPVGQRDSNPWGLQDMHGNVWEWVEDWYGPYSATAEVNPAGPSNGTQKVVRGGSFVDGAGVLRSAGRGRLGPEVRCTDFGFRCVRGPRRQP